MTPTDIRRPSAGRTIALLHHAAPPVVGGVERVLARQAVLMADAGHDVRIIAGRGASPDPRVRFVDLPLADPRHPSIERIQRELDAGRVPPGFDPIVAHIVDQLGAALVGVEVVIAHNVCSLNLDLPLTAALREVTARAGAPRLILWHHDLAATSPDRMPGLHPGMPWDLLRTEWPGARQVVVSETRRSELAALLRIPPESIVVVPNGVDMSPTGTLTGRVRAFADRADRAGVTPLLLVPTRITPRKNVELGLHVTAAMRAMGRAAGLVVTGPADPHRPSGRAYLDRLLRLRRGLALEDTTWFLSEEFGGPPTDAEMQDLYRLTDVLFLPSRDEGFGLPILEAAASRLPIVCTPLPALRELAGDAALYIGPDDDPAEVAARVLGLVDADAAGRLARRARTEYAWDVVYRERIEPLLAPEG
jgi:mannosylglucosylglycerate synthase